MTRLRIATYNVEWFDHLFDDQGALRFDDHWSGRHDVTHAQQIDALGLAFKALDADAVMVIEAPNTGRRRDGVYALEGFAAHFGLRARRAILGFENETQQEIMLLFDPDRLRAVHDPQGGLPLTSNPVDAPRFDQSLRIDLDFDGGPEKVVWSKPPLELAVETAKGTKLRLIGVHAKSKSPHGAKNDDDAMRLSIANRRKQLAQCIWLRRRVDAHLLAGESLIVMGDFNDGPGLDEYEKLFGRSGVEIVLGEGAARRLYDPHAQAAGQPRKFSAALPTTARFAVPPDWRWLMALLDYIMISPDLRGHAPKWRIFHPFEDPEIFADVPLREALLTASDHFPVLLEIDI